MVHRRSFGVVALVAGIAVLDGGQILRAAETGPEIGQQMYAAAMGEAHREARYLHPYPALHLSLNVQGVGARTGVQTLR